MSAVLPRRHPRQRAEHGFTLIELLVALGIMGLAAGVLSGGIGLAGRLTQTSNAARTAADEVSTAQLVLRERMARLLPLQRLTSAEPVIEMNGRPGELLFAAPPVGHREPDALLYYRVLLTAGGDLTLYSQSVLDERVDLGRRDVVGWTPLPLLARVRGLSFGYFGVDQRDGTRRWLTEWRSRPQPPDLVRLRVEFAPGDPRVWPDLVVRPRATVNTLCRIDALTGRCESA